MRILGGVLPYAGVLGGLVGLRSGWGAILGYHAGMLASLALGRGLGAFSLVGRGMSVVHLVVLGLVCALSGVLVHLLWPVMAVEGLVMVVGLASLGLVQGSWVGFIVYYCLVNPVMEEVYWRGWYAEDSVWPGPSDLLYAGYHGVVLWAFVGPGWVALAVVVVAGAGYVWRQVARRTGGLAVPVITHFVADVSIIAAAALLSV